LEEVKTTAASEQARAERRAAANLGADDGVFSLGPGAAQRARVAQRLAPAAHALLRRPPRHRRGDQPPVQLAMRSNRLAQRAVLAR